jgi:CobQ-like glutamine amidotransferase family enzyme
MKMTLAYFYPQELNLYGDTGNVEILIARAKARDFEVEVLEIGSETKVDGGLMKEIDMVFMGGGPDSGQKQMHEDLLKNKGAYLKEFIEKEGAALFICGSYQLMGRYYKSADGSELKGLSTFDLYTQHFGHDKKRCVGNVVCKLHDSILEDPIFKAVNNTGENIIGFENHGGRTYLGQDMKPLARVIKGYGNNSEDKTEGVYYKNAIGTYFHGPLLSKNPHIADFLIAKALKLENLSDLDDTIINTAHSALTKRFK